MAYHIHFITSMTHKITYSFWTNYKNVPYYTSTKFYVPIFGLVGYHIYDPQHGVYNTTNIRTTWHNTILVAHIFTYSFCLVHKNVQYGGYH